MTQIATIIQEKRAAWADLGEVVYNSELQLQAMAQEAILAIKKPATEQDLPEGEKTLVDIKAKRTRLEIARKEITNRFRDVSDRLMQPEKSLELAIGVLSNDIISIKQTKEKREAGEKAKKDELTALIERSLQLKNATDAKYKLAITEMVNKAYNYALGEGNIKPDALTEWMPLAENKMKLSDFPTPKQSIPLKLVSMQEMEEIFNSNCTVNPDLYLSLYKTELKKRFSDYQVAYENKQQALELANKEAAKKADEIKQAEENKNAANSLHLASSTPTVTTTTKLLKKSYVIDMPETFESAMAIMGAMVANKEKCLAKLKVNKWFAFTPGQAAIALGKVKCDENEFNPKGITFKEVAKL